MSSGKKMKVCQNKSTNISIDDEIQNILVKNPEKDIDIDFVQELSAEKSIKSNDSNDLRDTKYLHSIINDLQNVIKSKDKIINLLRNDIKTLQDQFNVNESSTWKSVSSISHENYIHKTQAKNLNWSIKTFIHTTNRDDTAEIDVQTVTNITNNTNNTSERERSKKSRKTSHYATTPYFVHR